MYLYVSENWIKVPPAVAAEFGGGDGVFEMRPNALKGILLDDEPTQYDNARERKRFEKALIKSVAKNDDAAVDYITVMGDRTLVIRSYDDDGSTMFYVIPCDGTACYNFLVVYDGRIHSLTPDVRSILSSLEKVSR